MKHGFENLFFADRILNTVTPQYAHKSCTTAACDLSHAKVKTGFLVEWISKLK